MPSGVYKRELAFVCDKETLYNLYHVEKLTQKQIADKFKVGQKVIWRRMRDFNIPARIPINNNQSGENNPSWKGGWYNDRGYIYVLMPEHPNAMKNGYVGLHTVNVTKKLGRPIQKGELIHHIDGNKGNNDINNLYVCDKREHKFLHHSLELVALEMFKYGVISFNDGEYIWQRQ
jgi:hypothetical protein